MPEIVCGVGSDLSIYSNIMFLESYTGAVSVYRNFDQAVMDIQVDEVQTLACASEKSEIFVQSATQTHVYNLMLSSLS